MVISFGVRIVDQAGNPVEGADVGVQYPWAIEHGWTDKDGWVRFEKSTAFGDSVYTAIYVEGVLRDSGLWIENENTFTYAV
jgi:hypothetical protein